MCFFIGGPEMRSIPGIAAAIRRTLFLCVLAGMAGAEASPARAQMLEAELLRVPAAELARLAKSEGDAQRGAVAFHSQLVACAKCHATGDDKPNPLGPDLALLGKEASDESLVEAVLLPSKVIRKGYETVKVATNDGRLVQGLLVERTPERIVLRDAERNFQSTTFAAADVDAIKLGDVSLMPQGQANQFTSRTQFLDLIRYLIEIRDGGAARARELRPSPAQLALTLPEYEGRLDHAGLIGEWNAESLKRGKAIYQRVCANCHGTPEQPGSLPTSLKFWEGKFKNGSDPLSMYHTLTRGFGQMTPQTWLVPSQKYDVIHYIRETHLKRSNASQYAVVDAAYLSRLPRGDTRGPEPSNFEPWSAMDYGPNLTHTYEIPGGSHNFAYKGVATRLDAGPGGVSRGRHWMVFDTDTLRVAAAWSAVENAKRDEPNFINWRGIQFNGEHQIHPKIAGQVALANPTGPGWANPASNSWRDDQRVLGRDNRRYGPLPRDWARFRGLYHHGQQVIYSYTVGDTPVLETHGLLASPESATSPMFLRTFNIGPRERDLTLQVAAVASEKASVESLPNGPAGAVIFNSAAVAVPSGPAKKLSPSKPLLAGVVPSNTSATWLAEEGHLCLKIPAGQQPLRFTVWTASRSDDNTAAQLTALEIPQADLDLATLTRGGPPRWPQKLATRATLGADQGPFAVDVLTPPDVNPWLAQTRFTGLDFMPDGRLAACTWDGDVWLVEYQSGREELQWQRVASGLFQPLGLKVVKGKIHVTCRDQLAVLHDLNGDGETDFYQCLNNDHQVTEHFHEFAMGLQTDAAGNFYYAKSARHALPAVVPHHGTLLKVSADGERTDILAVGFRAANGVCLNPDGSFVVTDQEGHWNPKNRINWVTLDPSGRPKFFGNMFGYHDVTDSADTAMQRPLCWITNNFDRSPGELLWVDSERWGPLNGSLLNLSYGYGKVFVAPHERVGDVIQGGLVALPIPAFPTGVMRGRFHPTEGQLYLCGMFAWAGSATQPGGLYRLRATGQPMHLPVKLQAKKGALELTFTEALAADSVHAKQVQVQSWSLKRTANYGSKHYDEHLLEIRGASLAADGKTVTLEIPSLQPTWCMEIKYDFQSASGTSVTGVLHNTIHALGE